MTVQTNTSDQWEFKNPEYLLLIILHFFFASFGFLENVRTLNFQTLLSKQGVFLFLAFAYYAGILLFTVLVFVRPNILTFCIEGLKKIQAIPALALGLIIGCCVAIIFLWRWQHPAVSYVFQLSLIVQLILIILPILFANWQWPRTPLTGFR